MFPWLLWVTQTYGLAALWRASPAIVSAQVSVFSSPWWIDRFLNTLGTLLPLAAVPAVMQHLSTPGVWWDIWLRFFYATLPGAITLTGTFVLYWRLRQPSAPSSALPRHIFGLLTIIGFLGGVFLQPDRNIFGLVGESMTPIVLLTLIRLVPLIVALTLRQQRLIFFFIGLEFTASQGFHLLLKMMSFIPLEDPNALLKEQYHLSFARDFIGSTWIGFALVIIAGYGFLFWRALRCQESYNQGGTP